MYKIFNSAFLDYVQQHICYPCYLSAEGVVSLSRFQSSRKYVPSEKYEVNEITSVIANTSGHDACAGLMPIFLKKIGRLHPRREAVTRVDKIVRDKVDEKL